MLTLNSQTQKINLFSFPVEWLAWFLTRAKNSDGFFFFLSFWALLHFQPTWESRTNRRLWYFGTAVFSVRKKQSIQTHTHTCTHTCTHTHAHTHAHLPHTHTCAHTHAHWRAHRRHLRWDVHEAAHALFFLWLSYVRETKIRFPSECLFRWKTQLFLDETGTNAENEIRKFLTTLEKSNFSISSELFSAKQS